MSDSTICSVSLSTDKSREIACFLPSVLTSNNTPFGAISVRFSTSHTWLKNFLSN